MQKYEGVRKRCFDKKEVVLPNVCVLIMVSNWQVGCIAPRVRDSRYTPRGVVRSTDQREYRIARPRRSGGGTPA
jgi:hypothetical protein